MKYKIILNELRQAVDTNSVECVYKCIEELETDLQDLWDFATDESEYEDIITDNDAIKHILGKYKFPKPFKFVGDENDN